MLPTPLPNPLFHSKAGRRKYRPISQSDNPATTGNIVNPVGAMVGNQGEFGSGMPTRENVSTYTAPANPASGWEEFLFNLTGGAMGRSNERPSGLLVAPIGTPNRTVLNPDGSYFSGAGNPNLLPPVNTGSGGGGRGRSVNRSSANPRQPIPFGGNLGSGMNPIESLIPPPLYGSGSNAPAYRGSVGSGMTRDTPATPERTSARTPTSFGYDMILYGLQTGQSTTVSASFAEANGLTETLSQPNSGWVMENGIWTNTNPTSNGQPTDPFSGVYRQENIGGQTLYVNEIGQRIDPTGKVVWSPDTATTDVYGGRFVQEGASKWQRINGRVQKVVARNGRWQVQGGAGGGGRLRREQDFGSSEPAQFTGSYGLVNFNTGSG